MKPPLNSHESAHRFPTLGPLLIVGCVLAGLSPAEAPAASPTPACPPNGLVLNGGPMIESSAAAFDTTDAPAASGGSFRAAYDLLPGELDLYHCCSLARTSVIARDAYDITGVPPGTPVRLEVQLVFDGAVFDAGSCGGGGCAGILGIELRQGSNVESRTHSITLFDGARAEIHDLLVLPVVLVAGESKTIEFQLWGMRTPGGSHGAEGHGLIRFVGLPPGSGIVSCQGYAGAGAPGVVASWGWIKSAYR